MQAVVWNHIVRNQVRINQKLRVWNSRDEGIDFSFDNPVDEEFDARQKRDVFQKPWFYTSPKCSIGTLKRINKTVVFWELWPPIWYKST